MRTWERRGWLLQTLSVRRHDTIPRLAAECGVSARTIRRDIEELSLHEPLYTQPGRYGGVYAMEGWSLRGRLTAAQSALMQKLIVRSEHGQASLLDERERASLRELLAVYAGPAGR